MKTYNLSKTASNVVYYYDSKQDRFLTNDNEGKTHGFQADVEVILDAGLYAHEYDELLNGVIAFLPFYS